MTYSFISIRLDSGLKHQLKEACEEKDIKVSWLTRKLLKSWLNEQKITTKETTNDEEKQ